MAYSAKDRLAILEEQLQDPNRNMTFDSELQSEIARMRAAADKEAAAAPVAPLRTVRFQGQLHRFPASFTDEQISEALASIAPASTAPRASQADVRKSEVEPTPKEAQDIRQQQFDAATKQYIKETGGVIPPGKNIRQAVVEKYGVTDPASTEEQAALDELAQGGDLTYGTSVPYAAAKGAAAIGGFALGGPPMATLAEATARLVPILSALDKAEKAGVITKEDAQNIFRKEMVKGVGEDALFNFGVPLAARLLKEVPGVSWLQGVIAKKLGKTLAPSADEAAQRQSKLDTLATQAKQAAATPAASDAVQELGRRVPGVIPTPGQATGEAGVTEQAARVIDPVKFDRAREKLIAGAEGMRQDLVNPSVQPSRQQLGQTIADTAEGVQRDVKTRLRPAFEAADNLGVKVDFSGVLQKAKDALAKDGLVPGERLDPIERQHLEKIVSSLEGTSQSGLTSNTQVPAEAALDFISRQKEKLRSATATYKPSDYFNAVLGDLMKGADTAFTQAATRAGRPDVAQNLLSARQQYGDMMGTVYEGAIKAALRKEATPEDIGRLIWQAGNVSEPQQLQKLLAMATREGTKTPGEAAKLSRDMVRGFLAEAVPDVGAAAKWSATLSAKPGLRDTWNTLTAAPGGAQLRNTMEVLEQAAKIAQRDHGDLLGSLGKAAIPLSRVAGGGVGISLVTGAVHPGMAAAGLSLDALLRMAATAYTQGNKGIMNSIVRAMRANTAGTAAGAKVLQETLPELQKYAASNSLPDIFVTPQAPQEQQ